MFIFCQVISTALKTLGKVLNAARPGFFTELFSSGNGATGETANKRARRESSPVCGDGEQSSDMKRANREKLAFMLYRRLRDSRWEVRDSTLEFVGSLVQLCNQGKSWLITYLTKNDQLLVSPYKFTDKFSEQSYTDNARDSNHVGEFLF